MKRYLRFIVTLPRRVLWCVRVHREARLLRRDGFAAAARPLTERSADSKRTPAGLETLVYLIAGTGRLPSSTCLTRSMALTRYLRRHSVPARLCVGVDLPGHGLDAHAWVEIRGAPINEPASANERFRQLELGS